VTGALGAYGIRQVPSSTPGAITCGSCGRSWTEDITPAGRCPWEAEHEPERPPVNLDDYEAQVHGESDDPWLVHTVCGEHLCDIEHDDTLAVLVSVARDHDGKCGA